MKMTIVGGGFGGVKTALELSTIADMQVTLITDKPDFQYYPALYGTATGRSHLQSWVPLSTIFEGKHNVTVIIDSVTTIDPEKRELRSASGATYHYETCVMALGVVTTYFGIKGIDEYSYSIKSEPEIKRLKQHIHDDLSKERKFDKHYVIVGAGPTGVELSAALGSYLERLRTQYGIRERSKVRVDLVEAAPRVLPRMSLATSTSVTRRLKKLGVNVMTGKSVESEDMDDLIVSGKPIQTKTVIWTSGVTNHPFYKTNGKYFKLAPNGRVIVDEYLSATKHVYVIGDNAATPFTGLAQTALHDALFIAENVRRKINHQPLKPYKAVMPPSVIPVGENWAVFEWHKLRLNGWIGSLIRRAADFIGYSDVLPIGQALGVWRAQKIVEDEFVEK